MILFFSSLVIKTTMIVVTLNYCSAATVSPSLHVTENAEQLPLIYRQFKINNFTATEVEHNIIFSWNIEQYTSKRPQKDDSDRKLETFELLNGNSISNVSINMKNHCKLGFYNGSIIINATCEYLYKNASCSNYKFFLGNSKNAAFIYVPVVKNTTTFELTENKENPAKLTWKTKCNTNNDMNSTQVSFTNDGKTVSLAVDANCNSTQQRCIAYFKRNDLIPCVPPVIEIHNETVLLDVATYSVNNFSIAVSNSDHFQIEWTDIVCTALNSTYKLVIIENGKNQIVENILVPNWCITFLNQSKPRRKLTFNKNRITACNATTNHLSFRTKLRPCFNYSAYVFRSENKNPTLGAVKSKNSFDIKLEPEDIQNLRVTSVSSNRFVLQWEISAGCRKLENFTIPIEKNFVLIQNLSLLASNAKCNDSTCTVSWESEQNLAACQNYLIKVGSLNMRVTTLPPGVFSIKENSPKSNNSSSFDLEWRVPLQCRSMLHNATTQIEVNQLENQSFTRSLLATLTGNCVDKINGSCYMRWRSEGKLEPCTTYNVQLGLFPQQFTTSPDFSGGIANNVTIQSKVPENLINPATPVIRWDHPNCKKSKILEWKILLTEISSNKTIIQTISNLEYSYKFFGAKPCESYNFTIRTIIENGNGFYSTPKEQFKVDCPMKLLVPMSLIAGLLLIAIIIALFLLRKRKRKEALIKETETNSKLSSVESRGRIPSISRNRLPSMNRNRISSVSRSSRNSSNENAEMDLDCLPQMTKRPMNIRDIFLFDIGQARKEFFLINKLTEIEAKRFPRTAAERPENKFKNRFLNTHPYDFNRVLLSQSEDSQGDGYINASFIPGFAEKEKEYIAAQGPKDNTLGDFWQMILEQDVRLIAMVTSLYECGKKKCEKYWPDKDELVVLGDNIQLELLEETTYSFYKKRNILVSKAPDFKREIQQFHFTAWPDFETPDQPEELIRFIEIVRRKARKWNVSSPIVVHCSAGVGRTGTFIALDYLIQQVLITDLIDVPKTVRHLRRYRLSMVQSEAQYVFLYSCIAHYVKTRLSQTEK